MSELDAAVAELLRKEPERSARAKWARRWFWKIDRTLDYARRSERLDNPFGLLAAAAVSLLEAKDLPEGDWNRIQKESEAGRLIELARGEKP